MGTIHIPEDNIRQHLEVIRNPDDQKTTLVNSKLQIQDPALYQVIDKFLGGSAQNNVSFKNSIDAFYSDYLKLVDFVNKIFRLTSTVTEINILNSGAAKTINFQSGNQQIIKLTDNCTFKVTGGNFGIDCILIILQDGTGGRTITWPANVYWDNNTPPVLDMTADKMSVVRLIKTSAGVGGYIGSAILGPINIPA